MKRAILAIAGTVSGLVLLLGFKTHPAAGPTASAGTVATPPTSGQNGAGSGTGNGGDGGGSGGSGGSGTSGKGSGTRTVTGDTIDTRWGPVQVRVTLSGSRITNVEAVRLPDGNPRDEEINGFAVPQLTQETLSAQSAQIDSVSGATYTSEGYIRSLQSALDRAGR